MHRKVAVAFFLLIFINTGFCSPPRILEHPTSIAVGREEPATLSCKAEGDPAPVIRWVKDDILVTTAPGDPTSHRVLLPSGSLFFLEVVQNRRVDDTGEYWCVAQNKNGEVTSNKAKLDLAFLKSSFVDEPLDSWVLFGDKIKLPCSPPSGFPGPLISWTKDNEELDLSNANRYRLEGGGLVILSSKQSDQGVYQCIASNVAATRSSHKANLSVYVKPYLIKSPENRSVDLGSGVDLACVVGGDPPPTTRWTAPTGLLNYRGSLLKIKQISAEDEGLYTCTGSNIAGSVKYTASIQVQNPPKFSMMPQDQKVPQGGKMTMGCTVESPDTHLYWVKGGSSHLYKHQHQSSRVSGGPRLGVDSTGKLTLNNAQKQDQGYYFCLLVSDSGSSIAAGRLSLKKKIGTKPPIIELGPVNQTLYRKDNGELHCQFSFRDTDTRVVWLKDGLPIELMNNIHFSLRDGNNLRISDVSESDSGVYTCQVKTTSGQTSASASITVLQQEREPGDIPIRPDILDFPASPGKPRLIDSSNNSVTVGWSKPTRVGKSPLRGYQVEYYNAEESNHWVSLSVQEEVLRVDHLMSSASLIFLVRARNEEGLSPPSLLSDPIKPAGADNSINNNNNLDNIINKLSGKLVEWGSISVNSPTTVNLRWNMLESWKLIEGFYLYIWSDQDQEDGLREPADITGDPRDNNINTIQISGGSTSSFLLSKLAPNTAYSAFLLPHANSVLGRPSSIIHFNTKETVPSSAPTKIELQLTEPSAAVASWLPPHPSTLGGTLTGYKVEILTNSTLVGNFSLDPSSTSLRLNNLTAGFIYSLKIAAFNRAGIGPYSEMVSLKVEPSLLYTPTIPKPANDLRSIQETWFVSFIGTFSILTILAAVSIVYFKRKSATSKQFNQYAVGDCKAAGSNENLTNMESDTLWINPKVNALSMYGTYHEKPTHLYINSVYPPEYAEVQQATHKNNKAVEDNVAVGVDYGSQGPCYASTDLMEQSFTKGSGEDRSSGEEHSLSTGETNTGSLSSHGKTSGERREKVSRSKKSLNNSQQSGFCDDLLGNFQQRGKLCYSVGNSPYHAAKNNPYTAASSSSYHASAGSPFHAAAGSPFHAPPTREAGSSSSYRVYGPPDPGLPPVPPNRGPSSFHGARVGSLTSFNHHGARFGSNFSVPGTTGFVEHSYRPSEREYDSQYECASIYQPATIALTHNTQAVQEGVHTSNQYMSCSSDQEESFYADSSFEDTYQKVPVQSTIEPLKGLRTRGSRGPPPFFPEEPIYSTFKPPPDDIKVPKRKQRMDRRLSDSGSRRTKKASLALQERVSQSASSSPAMNRRFHEDSAGCPDTNRRLQEDSNISNLSNRVSEDINEMVEQIQAIQNDISDLAGRPISLSK